MGIITSFTRTPRPRLPYWETAPSGMNGSLTFAFSANTLQLLHWRPDRPIRFSKAHIYVSTAAGDVEAAIFTSDGTNINRVATSGQVAAAGAGAIQVLDLGSSFEPVIGQDYLVGLGISSNALRILTIGTTAAPTALSLVQFAPNGAIGKQRQRTAITFPLASSYTIASIGNPGQPIPWIAFVDGV